jgi:hypothetical protein
MSTQISMGGQSVNAVAASILFADGTVQSTAAVPVPGNATQRQLVSAGTIGSALISLPITITWATPFSDNNYVVNASVEIGEPSSDGAVTSIICIASIQKQAGGVGCIVTVANADSVLHSCIINIQASHL